MARTPNVKIQDWGTPPEPEPTGWDAVAIELGKRPGEWANVGEMTAATARKVHTERLTAADGFEFRTVPVNGDARRVDVWIRKGDPAPAAAPKVRAPKSAAPKSEAAEA